MAQLVVQADTGRAEGEAAQKGAVEGALAGSNIAGIIITFPNIFDTAGGGAPYPAFGTRGLG